VRELLALFLASKNPKMDGSFYIKKGGAVIILELILLGAGALICLGLICAVFAIALKLLMGEEE